MAGVAGANAPAFVERAAWVTVTESYENVSPGIESKAGEFYRVGLEGSRTYWP